MRPSGGPPGLAIPTCAASIPSAATKIPCALLLVHRRSAAAFGTSPTHVGGAPLMNSLLFTQSALPLLELRDVDLALGEALLQDVERRA